jgi:CheY-like chemotaxis protein
MSLTQAVILCVDDEVLVLECLERQLRRAFSDLYRYEFAESADEALEIVEKLVEEGIQILVIISDWLMPGMKGDEFLLIIHNKYPDIITILLTGQADQSAVERAMTQANLHAYLYKPWKSKELIDTIKSGLAKL